MKLLVAVVSDTHRDMCSIEKVIDKIQRAEVVIHLGDNTGDAEEIAERFKGRVVSVRGNCDFASTVKSEVVEMLAGKRFLITHGHRYDVKNGLLRLQYRAEELQADVVLYGHSHISLVTFEKGIWYVNPGSAAESRNGAESIAFIEITEKGIYPTIVRI